MLEKIYRDKSIVQEFRQGIFGEHIDQLAIYFQELGYAKTKLKLRLNVIRRLSSWLAENNICLANLNDERLNQFIDIRKTEIKTFSGRGDATTLRYLIEHLRLYGIVPKASRVIPENESIEKIIKTYRQYLFDEKGLCPSTVRKNVNIINVFLTEEFGKLHVDFKKITRDLVLSYFRKFKNQHALKNLRVMASAIKSFLRYLIMIGEINPELANCIPAMPNWRAAYLPVFLLKSEMTRLLKACDRRTEKGRRNYAIILLLMRLGLRASEVLNLSLNDINWDLGELSVQGKGRKQRELPLPHDVGKALATYIYYARPACTDRQVFIRSRPPYRGLRNPSTISTIVRSALIAAGLRPLQMGAHLLRYTAAMQSLENGANLFEVGELLGHQSPDTTALYTKIDVVRLRTITQAWPVK